MLTGYGVYLDNHAMQIPLVQMLNEPGKYFAGDPFAQSLLKYGAPVWRVVAFLTDRFDQDAVLAVLFILDRILAIAAAGCLARALAPGSRLAMAAAMTYLASEPKALIGGGTILEKIFEHTTLSIGFFLLAFAAVVARRPWTWAVTWVLAFFCNPMYGFFASIYLGLLLLFDGDLRAEWRRWLKPLAVALALIIPQLLWSLIKMRPEPYDHDIWYRVSIVRAEHHMNPAAWPPLDWFLMLLLLALSGTAAWRLRKMRPQLARFLGASALACLFWILITIVAYVLENDTLMVLHGGRGTDLFYLFAGIGLIALLAPREVSERPVALSLLLLLILMPYYYHGWKGLAFFALIPIVWALRPRPVSVNWAIAGLVATMASITLWHTVFVNEGEVLVKVENDVRKVGKWAREETPLDAMFLVNPEWQEFRAIARRGVFVTWKDAGAIPWQRDYATEWVARLKGLGADVLAAQDQSHAQEELDAAWHNLSDDQAAALSEQYGLDYWVVAEEKQSRYPEVYSYGDSRVLKLVLD